MNTLNCAVFALCALVQAGCGADRPAASVDASGSPSSDADVVSCVGTKIFPTFDKTCTSAADCVIGEHMISRCGSLQFIGMNAAEQARFVADEATCHHQYFLQYGPGGGCPPSATRAEDGQSSFDVSKIVVECQSNQCLTKCQSNQCLTSVK